MVIENNKTSSQFYLTTIEYFQMYSQISRTKKKGKKITKFSYGFQSFFVHKQLCFSGVAASTYKLHQIFLMERENLPKLVFSFY